MSLMELLVDWAQLRKESLREYINRIFQKQKEPRLGEKKKNRIFKDCGTTIKVKHTCNGKENLAEMGHG